MAENEPKKEAGGGGGGNSKLLLVLLGVNSLMLAGVMAVVLLRSPGAAPKAAAAPAIDHGSADAKAEGDAHGDKAKAAEKANLPGPSVRLPDFVVHLRDPEVDRYARLAIEVELADEKAKEQFTARMPQVRDSFIAYLSDRTTSDLRGSEAITRVKTDLTERLRSAVPGLTFRALYMTELVVQ